MSDEPTDQPPHGPRAQPRPPRELDPTIIHQAIFEGSAAAFVLLYRHYEGGVRHAIARAAMHSGMCRREDVEDLIQAVWCRLLAHDRRTLRYYDATRGRLGPFLRWVAYQMAHDLAHRQRRKRFPTDGPPPPDDGLLDERALRFLVDLVQSDFIRKLIARVDAQLTAVDRRVLLEHYLGERTLRDLAGELGLAENALAKRNERLKSKLSKVARSMLQGEVSAPPPSVVISILIAWLCALEAEDEPMRPHESLVCHGAGPLNRSSH